MGGYSSTRWGSVITRQETDPLPSLDIRWLRKSGALEPTAVTHPQWTTRGETTCMIQTAMSADGHTLTLTYRTRSLGQAWTGLEEAISLDATPCTYGGERVWFRCPGCGGRRAVLYALRGAFRCRGCHHLAYSSTREDPYERSLRRGAELRRKIGGEFGQPSWAIPPKPEGMTQRAYLRVVRRLIREITWQSGVE